MKIVPDTSVMVPSFLKTHENHTRVMPWIQRIVSGELTAVWAAHSVAETYSVITRLPAPMCLTPEICVERNRN